MQTFDYCERLDSSFWAEPINALSNIFFIVTAILALYYLFKRSTTAPKLLSLLLISILIFIGVGSFLWHTYAVRWAELADVIPIAIFLHLYIFVFFRYMLLKSFSISLFIVGIFIFLNYLFESFVNLSIFNGSIAYLPALLFLIFMNLLTHEKREYHDLRLATSIFVISLIFRSVDFIVCDVIAIGTHAFWHAFNAIMLFLLIKLFIDRSQIAH